jgi:hypothetical protein
MPVTDLAIKQVEEMAVKDGAVKVINFKDRKGVKNEFDNDEEYEMLVEPDEPTPFPDIATESPGMLTKLKEEFGINDVVQDEPKMSDEQQAVLAANNSGLDISSVPTKVTGGEVIEILDNNAEDMMNKYHREEVLVKIEPYQILELLLSWQVTREGLGELKLGTDNLRTVSCIPPWKKRNS